MPSRRQGRGAARMSGSPAPHRMCCAQAVALGLLLASNAVRQTHCVKRSAASVNQTPARMPRFGWKGVGEGESRRRGREGEGRRGWKGVGAGGSRRRGSRERERVDAGGRESEREWESARVEGRRRGGVASTRDGGRALKKEERKGRVDERRGRQRESKRVEGSRSRRV
eukprot:3838706-Rhodomonas_salina.1